MTKPYLVSVGFDDGRSKPYSFKCLVPGVKKGDRVVVKCSTGYQVCKVLSVSAETPPPEATAYVMVVLDIEAHEAKIEAAEAYEELTARINARVTEAAKERELKKLAKSDPVLAELLQERDSL